MKVAPCFLVSLFTFGCGVVTRRGVKEKPRIWEDEDDLPGSSMPRILIFPSVFALLLIASIASADGVLPKGTVDTAMPRRSPSIRDANSSNWTLNQFITTGVSVTALLLGALNFALAKRSDRKRRDRQQRDDRISAHRLLDTAWEAIYGPGGYSETGDPTRFDDAKSAIEQAERIAGLDYPRVMDYRGRLFESQGNNDAARQCYEESVTLDPSRMTAHNNLGRVLTGKESICCFRRAIECDPLAALPHYSLGKEFIKSNDLKDAEKHFERAVELKPRFASAHTELAQLHERSKKFRDAQVSYEKAISAEPGSIEAMVRLGSMLAQRGEWDKGVGWIEQAMRIDPRDGYPYGMMAALHADRQEPEEALRWHKEAVAIDPTRRVSDDPAQDLERAMRKLLKKED